MSIHPLRLVTSVSLLGCLVPLAWPARRLTLTGLLASMAGVALNALLCPAAFLRGGWTGCLLAFLAVNLFSSSAWLAFVAWVAPSDKGRSEGLGGR